MYIRNPFWSPQFLYGSVQDRFGLRITARPFPSLTSVALPKSPSERRQQSLNPFRGIFLQYMFSGLELWASIFTDLVAYCAVTSTIVLLNAYILIGPAWYRFKQYLRFLWQVERDINFGFLKEYLSNFAGDLPTQHETEETLTWP